MPMKVVLDTNILDDHMGKSSESMRALSTLARENKVNICIPHVVEREHRSHIEYKARKALSEASKAIGALNQVLHETDVDVDLKALGIRLSEIRSKNLYPYILDEWIEDVGAEIVFPTHNHSLEVVDAYFDGVKPFKQKKNKNDFPDAFIWVLVKQIAADNPVAFITNDGGFTGVDIKDLPITLYSTLEKFLQTPEMQILLSSAQETANVETLRREYKRTEPAVMDLLSDEIQGYLDRLTSVNLGNPFEPGSVEHVYDAENVDIDIENLEYYGDGIVVVPFHFEAKIEFEEEVPFDQYLEAIEANEAIMDPEIFEDDHFTSRYFSVSRERRFDFYGNARLNFGENLSRPLSMEELLDEMVSSELTFEGIYHEIK